MSRVQSVPLADWSGRPSGDARALTALLEDGRVVFLPNLAFQVAAHEAAIFSPTILSSSKNASFDPATGRVNGTTLTGAELDVLRAVILRFSDAANSLVTTLFADYARHLTRARASFRPAEIAGRQTSWRKDDTRLHVDAFPASPVQGRRILRVFTNVNPSDRPRRWRVGGPFEALARRFAPRLSPPRPGTAPLLEWLHVTKSRRTPYDGLMLQLHDQMKADEAFQRDSEQETVELPAGSTWVCFTDSVSHAAMAGQYQLEQTFLLPIEAMQDSSRSPLRILEGLKGRSLL